MWFNLLKEIPSMEYRFRKLWALPHNKWQLGSLKLQRQDKLNPEKGLVPGTRVLLRTGFSLWRFLCNHNRGITKLTFGLFARGFYFSVSRKRGKVCLFILFYSIGSPGILRLSCNMQRVDASRLTAQINRTDVDGKAGKGDLRVHMFEISQTVWRCR